VASALSMMEPQTDPNISEVLLIKERWYLPYLWCSLHLICRCLGWIGPKTASLPFEDETCGILQSIVLAWRYGKTQECKFVLNFSLQVGNPLFLCRTKAVHSILKCALDLPTSIDTYEYICTYIFVYICMNMCVYWSLWWVLYWW